MDHGLISQKGRGLTVKWWGFFLVRIYFSIEKSWWTEHPWTAGTPVHGGLAMPGRRGLTGARPSGPSGAQWVTGGGATEGGVHGVSTLGLTGARAAM
jgi:hypothetical protein